jgi:predicted N-acetyltransferase YhbS
LSAIQKPEPIGPNHLVGAFDCGEAALNDYLAKFALQNHQAGAARTFVATTDGRTVIAYYSLAAAEVKFDDAPARLQRGVAHHPVPVILLARLAVSKDSQGQGVGFGILKDAILRVLQAAERVGVRAILVHAKDEAAKAFYQRFDFEPLPKHSLHLVLPLKAARKYVAG